MKLASFRRFSGLLWFLLIPGCGAGPDPSSISDASAAQADPKPAPPEIGQRKAAPKGPSAVSPASAY